MRAGQEHPRDSAKWASTNGPKNGPTKKKDIGQKDLSVSTRTCSCCHSRARSQLRAITCRRSQSRGTTWPGDGGPTPSDSFRGNRVALILHRDRPCAVRTASCVVIRIRLAAHFRVNLLNIGQQCRFHFSHLDGLNSREKGDSGS